MFALPIQNGNKLEFKMSNTVELTLDLGQLGERDAIVEFSYGAAEPENGVPEDFEVLSVKIAGMEFGKKIWIEIGQALYDNDIEKIIKQIKEV